MMPHPGGRPPRVPGQKLRRVVVYVAQCEFDRLRVVAALNQQKVGEFMRDAANEAAAESGERPPFVERRAVGRR